MTTLTFRTDLLRAEVETLMNWKFNKEFIECDKKEADYRVVEKWANHENKMRQRTIYLRVDESAEAVKAAEYLKEIHDTYEIN